MTQGGVTFREFSSLAKKRGWTVEMLAETFKAKIGVADADDNFKENLRSFFLRVLTCQWLNPETHRMESRADVVIPYRSMMEFYQRELFYQTNKGIKQPTYPAEPGKRACACGCGEAVFGIKSGRCPGAAKERSETSL